MSGQLRVGGEILEYRIEGLIGRGGMGVVYRAYDVRLKRSLALKLVAPELSQDDRLRTRFLSETELAASLEHPNVVPIYGAGEADGGLYLAMRLVDGSDLKSLLLAEAPLESERALAICAQIADALDAAHERGLVHRDVKPSNVLLDRDEHVYLSDFGLARWLGELGLDAEPGLSLGTPAYAAPEQIAGGSVDGRADVYALGCLLYECLTGEVPYPRSSELAVLFAHLNDPPPALAASPTLDPVIAAALAKDPDDRYASCGELVEACREALGLRDVVARDRRPLLLAVAGVALAVAAGLAALVLGQTGDGPSRPSTKATAVPTTDALQRIDPVSNRLAATLTTSTLGSDPTGVAVGDGAVWVIHLDANRISKINARTNAVVATGSAPGPRTVTVGGGSVWVATADGIVAQYDSTGSNVHGVRIPSALQPVELSTYGSGGVWVASPVSGLVGRINPQSSSVGATVASGALKGAVKGIAAGDRAVWISSSDILADDYAATRIDPVGNRVTERVPLRLGAEGISVGEGSVWVANSLGNTVSQIAPATNRVVRRIRVGEDPVAVAAGGGAVWVTNYKDGTVSRLDPRQGRVVATIPVGPNPDHVAVGEGGVWVTVHVR